MHTHTHTHTHNKRAHPAHKNGPHTSHRSLQAVVTLRRQYRMAADIMSLSNTLVYSGALLCGSDAVAGGRLQLPGHPSPSLPAWVLQVRPAHLSPACPACPAALFLPWAFATSPQCNTPPLSPCRWCFHSPLSLFFFHLPPLRPWRSCASSCPLPWAHGWAVLSPPVHLGGWWGLNSVLVVTQPCCCGF